ncbi:MAG TPA: M1 family metallopeptidase [Longimicrobiales bacterium]|nr:M1 family metallopeptidase [Longimicrobiales bacterium]
MRSEAWGAAFGALVTLWGGAAAGQARAPAEVPPRVVTPPSFDSAVARGTRTRTGEPGARYWQNGADYDITAQVTPADSTLRGQERVTYRNGSPETLRAVVFHVYQNLFAPTGARETPTPAVTSGMVLEEVRENGRVVGLPDNIVGASRDSTAAREYGTLLIVPLATSLAPGATATFDIRWRFKIPGAWAPRMGMQDPTTAQVAQWYPQIAVFDDVNGWDAQQYTGTGEFYLDYGRFRYSVTLPAGFIVGGTGTLQNPDSVLNPATVSVLRRAANATNVVHVLGPTQLGAGRATKGAGGTQLTWTFVADSVRDVAFSFSDHYLWDATSAVVDPATRRRALVQVMYRQGAPLYDQAWRMVQSALESFSRRLAPYPYPQMTQTEGGSGGMEYPMTVFVQAYPEPYRMDEVTAHEIGHEWFPMVVGSNETRYGWQDEGLNTFDTFFATDDFFRDTLQGRGLEEAQAGYIRYARRSEEPLVMMSPANAFGVEPQADYSVEAYDKPSSVLYALMRTLGEETFYRAYREYIRRWAYKHPTPYDFFNTMSSVSGRELEPFWFQWFFTDERLDQAVSAVQQVGDSVTVTVQNVGTVYAPIDVTARTADGKSVAWRVDDTAWYSGRTTLTTTHAVKGRVVEVTLDAARSYPDVERGNNVWRGGP